ncbi:E3 ubiquitin-protein transferase MAEA [Caenorhabditis elegans]|uniref:E3 ubiquitin-protein transferase MAEA n=1 Tax=Caenorhabditis elegans TaxID=6239 RepID=O18188_CAEEL|nr:Macrophage erythroblast attacher [Caenorhabditis elegans]CAB04951.1 Macrophage erythroblast attacher [Caenorhabditis elegans]|eukprot:NP_493416.1 MAEA (MAcrophage Erythroblast Attacher protein) homolog [Caenorhabditis elegans]
MMMEIEDDEVPSPPSPHPAGTTIGGPNSKRYSDILSLDYCTFRIPYEELNIRFRNGQKDLDRAATGVAKAAELLQKKTAGSNEPVSRESLRRHFDLLIRQVQEARKTVERITQSEIEQLDKITTRADRIHEEFEVTRDSENPRNTEKLERQKFCRFIVWHMLRCGYIEPAKVLVKEMELEDLVDVDVFENMYAVQQALLDGNIQPCLAWCDRHHRKLRKLESRIELVARQQEAVTLIELGNIPEAVAYVKKYIAPIAKGKFTEDLKKTMGAIACTLEQSRLRNPELHAADRYQKCAALFIEEAHRIFEIHGNTALATLIQYGLATQKTPSCHNDEKTPLDKQKCIVCRPDVWPIAENLPYSHVANSRIFCSLSGKLCDDDKNIPFLFPSGHVIGSAAIERLKRDDNKLYDPIHKKLIDEEEALRLYFL